MPDDENVTRSDPDLSARLRDASLTTADLGLLGAGATRARAQRRRNRRRTLAAGTLSLLVIGGVAMASGGSGLLVTTPTPPAQLPTAVPSTHDTPTGPPPSPSFDPPTGPVPTTTPTNGEASTAPAQGWVDEEVVEAATPTRAPQWALADFRFPIEEQWDDDPIQEFAMEVELDPRWWRNAACDGATAAPDAIAMRTVIKPGPDVEASRQVAVFPDEETAAAAFEDLRSALADCNVAHTDDQGVETTYIYEPIFFADDGFWEAQISDPPDDGTFGPGVELHYSDMSVSLLDGAVIYVATAQAFSDEMRAEALAALGDEFEAVQPQLDDLQP